LLDDDDDDVLLNVFNVVVVGTVERLVNGCERFGDVGDDEQDDDDVGVNG